MLYNIYNIGLTSGERRMLKKMKKINHLAPSSNIFIQDSFYPRRKLLKNNIGNKY